MNAFAARLRHHMQEVRAARSEEASGSDGLKVLVSRQDHNVVTRLYKEHISEDNMAHLPRFMNELDIMLLKYGAKPEVEEKAEKADKEEG